MELKRALEILEYNKAMLTCDMSISRDPEHQDVSPDYYGKDAEDLYNAIVCVENYIKKAIPIGWIEEWLDKTTGTRDGEDISQLPEQLKFAIQMINLMEMEWEKASINSFV